MQHSIGEIIRQVRRQRNLTQTELGGDRYSKSYVSAVERNKIISSRDALRYFAEQLGQFGDYFVELVEEPDAREQMTIVGDVTVQSASQAQNNALNLLDVLLESTDLSQLTIGRNAPSFSPELVAALPPQKQFRFYFLMGLAAKEQNARAAALSAFEYALALAPTQQQPAILDELGSYYVAENAHHVALVYFQRALHMLQDDTRSTLKFKLELHCAESYQTLGAYEQAITFYEQARQHLRSDHGLRTAAMLYLGLGYCTYAAIQQKEVLTGSSDGRVGSRPTAVTEDEMEIIYRSAVSYLIQSRSVFQVTDDLMGETQVRMTLAFVLLDFCAQRKKFGQTMAHDGQQLVAKKCASLLDDAEDQCRQVLLSWQKSRNSVVTDIERTDIIASACTGLIHCAVQRALLAHAEGYSETVGREISTALYICEQMLDGFKNPEQSWYIIGNVTNITQTVLKGRSTSLPREPAIPAIEQHNALPLTEVYMALGTTAEAIGRISTVNNYSDECYLQATHWFESALAQAQSAVQGNRVDAGYLPRCYQHCISLLEERARHSSFVTEEDIIILLNMLKTGLSMMQNTPL